MMKHWTNTESSLRNIAETWAGPDSKRNQWYRKHTTLTSENVRSAHTYLRDKYG